MNNPDYKEVYRHLFQTDPPATVTWGTSQADILSPGRGFMGAFDFTMQLQVGCPVGQAGFASLTAPQRVMK